MRRFASLLCAALAFAACEKQPVKEDIPLPAAQEGGIFILNEGGYNSGTASVGFYDFKAKTLTDDVFFVANKRHLGDVLQSAYMHNGDIYLVVNNSKKIEIIDASTFLSKGTITGFNSPRYMLMTDEGKAYVSDLYDNQIAVVDMNTKAIVRKIPCAGATEQMLLMNNKVYVCNTMRESIYIIDPATDQLTDSIPLSYGPNSIVKDKNNKLWVLCSGDLAKQLSAGLYRIDPVVDTVEMAIKNIYPGGIFGANKLVMNGDQDRLYWLNADVYALDITDSVLPAQPFLKAFNSHFYGLGVDPVDKEVYVSDALDYVQKSTITHYNESGELKGTFKGGIITSGFFFYYK